MLRAALVNVPRDKPAQSSDCRCRTNERSISDAKYPRHTTRTCDPSCLRLPGISRAARIDVVSVSNFGSLARCDRFGEVSVAAQVLSYSTHAY